MSEPLAPIGINPPSSTPGIPMSTDPLVSPNLSVPTDLGISASSASPNPPAPSVPAVSPNPATLPIPANPEYRPNPSYRPHPQPYPYGPPFIAPPKKTYTFNGNEPIFVLVTLIIGYLFWAWLPPRSTDYIDDRFMLNTAYTQAGIAIPVFFGLVLACSFVYFQLQKVTITRATIMGAALIMAGALPYAIYAFKAIQIPFMLLLLIATIVWHGLAGGTLMARRPDGDLVGDLWNQVLVVPFRNFGAWFHGIRAGLTGRAKTRSVVIALIGILVSLPIFAVVLALLVSADQSFSDLMNRIGDALVDLDMWRIIWHVVFAIPVAFYLFGLMWGNAHRVGLDFVTREKCDRVAASVRRVRVAAIATPTVMLCLIYVVFFSAMGSYLFSAFGGAKPDGFTFAEYARRGFFELAAVATINACVLLFTYLFARRRLAGGDATDEGSGASQGQGQPSAGRADVYPRTLRILGAILSVLTLLLIATSISKMVLYVGAFGLSRQRLYTLIFMVVLGIMFLFVAAWHVRRYRVSLFLVVIGVISLLGFSWTNTDGIIATYNVSGYLSGDIATIDVDYLAGDMFDASVPSLVQLRDKAPDQAVRQEATEALQDNGAYGISPDHQDQVPWMSWTWQSWQAQHQGG